MTAALRELTQLKCTSKAPLVILHRIKQIFIKGKNKQIKGLSLRLINLQKTTIWFLKQ